LRAVCKKCNLEFKVRYDTHFRTDRPNPTGCPDCGRKNGNAKKSKGYEEFVKQAIEKHGDTYDYSKVVYKNNNTEVTIICKTHGEFIQRPTHHLIGQGCNNCANIKRRDAQLSSTPEFVEKATKMHDGYYTYPNTKYVDADTQIEIECKFHGPFLQVPRSHLSGAGCYKCGKYKTEECCREIFKELGYKTEKGRPTFLGSLELDGYNAELKLGWEYNGIQHEKHIPFFHKTVKDFEDQKQRDVLKIERCNTHGVCLIVIPSKYTHTDKIELRKYIETEVANKYVKK
jgi:hypothetical protein